jgi:hypothetical protein
MRTPEFATALNSIAKVNDMFLTFVVAHVEFSRGFSRFAPSIRDRYFPEFFVDVPVARSLNFRIGDFQQVLDENRNFTAQAYFAWLHAAIEVYFSDLATRIYDVLGIAKSRASYAHRVAAMIGTTLPAMIGQERTDTLDYLRHRRNILIHASGPSAREMPRLAARIRGPLQNFWATLGHPLVALDFRGTALDEFSYEEMIDLLRVSRNCLIEFDSAFLRAIGRSLLKAELVRRIKGDPYLRALDRSAALLRVRGPVGAAYGMTSSDRRKWFTP